jgi:5-formyltetrahydrofolate cyclo-ligase
MARDFADKGAARQWVWDRLVAQGVARFPFPPHGRIPNCAGAEVATARLFNTEPWKSAKAIKVNPDSPQRPLRAEALRRGITVFVPTPRLRGGFKKLDPRRIPPDKIEEAASLSRGDGWSEEITGGALTVQELKNGPAAMRALGLAAASPPPEGCDVRC